MSQKSKIKWSIEGDEKSKYYHGIINQRRSQLAITSAKVDGDWVTNPTKVKFIFFENFRYKFKKILCAGVKNRCSLFKST